MCVCLLTFNPQDVALLRYNAIARELQDLKKQYADHSSRHNRCSFIDRFFCRARIRELRRDLANAKDDAQGLYEKWRTTNRDLMRTEIVLEKQRVYMKVKTDVLQRTQGELVAVRRKLEVTERALQDRKVALEVLRQNNRDLMLEMKCLRHRTTAHGKRNITV
jgi:chromosome segregation ATPase